MNASHDHLNDLRQLAARRASQRAVEPEPDPVDDQPSGAIVIEATDLVAGLIRWRDASPEARRIARSWGDRQPYDEPAARGSR